jgi:hypothetical protein
METEEKREKRLAVQRERLRFLEEMIRSIFPFSDRKIYIRMREKLRNQTEEQRDRNRAAARK